MESNSRSRATRYGLTGAVVALGIVAASAGMASTASASPNAGTAITQVNDSCGYLGWGKYRHCDGGTGSTVMLDVEDFFGNIFHECVGPGISDLQPGIRWAVTGAWWNGGVRCAPGFYGPA